MVLFFWVFSVFVLLFCMFVFGGSWYFGFLVCFSLCLVIVAFGILGVFWVWYNTAKCVLWFCIRIDGLNLCFGCWVGLGFVPFLPPFRVFGFGVFVLPRGFGF